MKAMRLKSLLILWNSQGLFQGDGNRVQQFCKSWFLTNDQDQKVDLLKVQTLAQNPDVYKALFEPMSDFEPEDNWQTIDQGPIDEESVLEEIQRWSSQREESL